MLAEQTAEIERIVLPHSAYELENALHLDELPRVRYTWVRIAAKQMGVGGDDSWGAPVHEEYCIPADQSMTDTTHPPEPEASVGALRRTNIFTALDFAAILV